jgi:hypothetical protein
MRRQPVWYIVAAIAASMLAVALAGLTYTSHVQRQADRRHDQIVRDSERKWCEFVVVLDDAWSATPPQSPLGRQVAASLHTLRIDFGC